jgi:hypothetical protein
MIALTAARLGAMLISVNPFERTERAIRISERVFDHGAVIHQRPFFDEFTRPGLKGTLCLGE